MKVGELMLGISVNQILCMTQPETISPFRKRNEQGMSL